MAPRAWRRGTSRAARVRALDRVAGLRGDLDGRAAAQIGLIQRRFVLRPESLV
jgi:hypothetical protein